MSNIILSKYPKEHKRTVKDELPLIASMILIIIAIAYAFSLILKPVESIPELNSAPITNDSKQIIENPIIKPMAKEVIPSDEELIASVVMAEAKGEELLGKVAVAAVVYNRCDMWGLTVESVLNQENQFATGEKPNEDCYRAVEIAKENRDLFKSSMIYFRGGYYHEDLGEPYMQIGNHYFSCEED